MEKKLNIIGIVIGVLSSLFSTIYFVENRFAKNEDISRLENKIQLLEAKRTRDIINRLKYSTEEGKKEELKHILKDVDIRIKKFQD